MRLLRPMPRHLLPAVALAVALAAAPLATAQEEVVRKARTFDLAVEAGLDLEGADARAIQKELEAGFDAAFELLDVGERQVFYDGLPTPSWMGEVGKMTFVLRPAVREDAATVEKWTKGLFAGGFRMDLPFPADDLTPEYRGRLRRAAGAAVLGNCLYRCAPLWWTEGVLTWLEAAAEGSDLRAKLREEVRGIPPDGIPDRVTGLLDSTTPKAMAPIQGHAVSFALVDLLVETCPNAIANLERQMQFLAYHLYFFPSDSRLREEFSAIARAALTEMVPEDELGLSLAAWAGEGFPTGSDLRRVKALRGIRRAKTPDPYAVRLTGHWSNTHVDDDGNRFRTWEQGSVAFHLPPVVAKGVLWVGVHEKLPRGTKFEPNHMDDGLGVTMHTWTGDCDGNLTTPARDVIFGYLNPKYEFALLDVTSDRGLIYRFYRYGKCR